MATNLTRLEPLRVFFFEDVWRLGCFIKSAHSPET
jgi:hypothetical protein